MIFRLNRIPYKVLINVENEENKELRLKWIEETDYERAMNMHSNTVVKGFLLTALGSAIYYNDEDSAHALLDGGYE